MFRHKKGEQYFKDTLKKLIRNQRNKRVKSIIANSNPTDLIDSTGTTMLHLAAKYNNTELIEFLIEKVAYNVDGKDLQGMTPLMIAVLCNNYEAIELLLEYKADVFTANATGGNALKMISKTKSNTPRTLQLIFDSVKSRFKTNEEIAAKLAEASFPLDLVIELKNAEVTKLILKKGNPIDEIERYRSMLNAFHSLDVENIKVLLFFGITMREANHNYFFQFFNNHVRATNPDKWNHVRVLTPTFIKWRLVNIGTIGYFEKLFEKGQLEPLKMFLECGLHTYIKRKLKYDLTVHFFGNQNIDVFDILNKNEFDVNARGRGDFTALHIAVASGVVKNVRYLLESGANPNSKTMQGITPIFMSLIRPESPYGDDSVKCVRLLLDYGADPQVVDKLGRCLFDIYEMNDRNGDVIEVIVAEIVLLDNLGVKINKTISECINTDNFDDLKDCFDYCKEQMEKMKMFKICDSLTAFDVLAKKPGQIARIVGAQGEEKFLEILNCKDLKELNCYYNTFFDRFVVAGLMDLCRNNISNTIADNIVMLKRNALIIDKIVSNLSLKDLVLYEILNNTERIYL